MKSDAQKWNDALRCNDSKLFWRYVDWKGNLKSKKLLNSPALQQFEVFFEDLYKCDNQRELYEIMEIQSDVVMKSANCLDISDVF